MSQASARKATLHKKLHARVLNPRVDQMISAPYCALSREIVMWLTSRAAAVTVNSLTQRLERRAELSAIKLRLLPSREMAAPIDLVVEHLIFGQ